MDNRRRLELIWQEVRRKRQIARLDAANRLEHLEVAEALAYAAEIISREDESCKLAIKSSLPPLRLRVKKQQGPGGQSSEAQESCGACDLHTPGPAVLHGFGGGQRADHPREL